MVMIEWKTSIVPVAGIDLHVTRAGTGSPIVVLHHDVGTLEHLPFYDALAHDHEVLIPHYPGYGVSPRSDWVGNVRDVAVLCRMLLGNLNLQHATLVGLGFGGWIASEMATFAPVDTPRLVLVGAMGLKPPKGDIFDQALVSYIEYVREGFHDKDCFERNFGTRPSTEQLVHWDLCREMSFRIAWKPYMYSDSLPYLLRGVRSRSLIVWGDDNRIVPLSAGALYADRLPNATLETIPGAGHLIDMEQPEKLVQLITSFIASP